jgi:Tfp pilus assembly protein PilF
MEQRDSAGASNTLRTAIQYDPNNRTAQDLLSKISQTTTASVTEQ